MKCPASCGADPARWAVLSVDGRPGKHAITFWCRSCHRQRLQLADVEDLERAVHYVAHRYLEEHHVRTSRVRADNDFHGQGPHASQWVVDRDEFVASLTTEAWSIWVRWQPDRGVPFGAFLFRYLPLRGNEYFRSLLGRHGQKPQALAAGLLPGGDRLDDALAEEPRDPTVLRDPDLARVLGG